MSARLLALGAVMAAAVSAAPQAENTTPTYSLADPVYVTPTYSLGDPVYFTPTYSLGDPVYATPTYALGDPVYFTTVVSSYTTYCPKATTIVHNGKTITAHGPTTLTITDCPCTITTTAPPAASTAAGDCLSKCNAEHDKCVTAPDANMSFCSAKYSECLGYNPWGSGSFVTPTACAAGAASTKPPTVVPTAAAGRVAIPGALAALGALAML